METPAIVVALLLAGRGRTDGQSLRAVLARILASKSIVLLFGGLVIGMIVGREGLAPVKRSVSRTALPFPARSRP